MCSFFFYPISNPWIITSALLFNTHDEHDTHHLRKKSIILHVHDLSKQNFHKHRNHTTFLVYTAPLDNSLRNR